MSRKRPRKKSISWESHTQHARAKELVGVQRWVAVLTARHKKAPDDSWVKGMLTHYTQRLGELEILISGDKDAK